MYHVDDWPLVVGGVYDTLAAQCIDRVSDPDLVRSSVRDIADQLATTNGVVRVDRHDPVTSRSIRMLLTLGGHAAWPLTLTHARVNRIVEMRARHSWTSTPWESPALSDAARCLALRYFSTYGPALESDFRYMMGILAEPSRRAVADLLADGTLSDIGNGLLLPTVLRRDWQRFRAGPVPLRMLYCFDPLVLAHARKTWLIEDAYRSLIWTRNAIVHGVVLVDGRIAGKWTLGRQRRRQQTEARIEVEIFSDAFAIDRAAACAQLNGIAVCLDLKSLSVEWR